MCKRLSLFSILCVLILFGSISTTLSADIGPEVMMLKNSVSNKKEPAVFPHKLHQEAFECGECHHSMIDGQQVPYSESMKIEKCESCHNPEVLGGRKKGKYKLDSYKGAGHGNCLECHKKLANADDSMKKLKSCKKCHQKSPRMITIRDGKKAQ